MDPPGSVIGSVWLCHVAAAPVDVIVAVVRIGPSTASSLTSTAAVGLPAGSCVDVLATRKVSTSMFSRSTVPLSAIQSPLLKLPRCWPPPSGSFVVATFVPDWSEANSTS